MCKDLDNNPNSDVLSALLSKCEERDGKLYLACIKASEIAKQEGTSLSIIGELCEQYKIKINSCQLRCF